MTINHGRTEPYDLGNGYGHIAVAVNDLDEIAHEFRNLIANDGSLSSATRDNHTLPLQIRVIADPLATNLEPSSQNSVDLTSVYDVLVARWLTTLNHQVPGRVRLAKEQLMRRVSADLCLGSCVLKRAGEHEEINETASVAQDNRMEEDLDLESNHPRSSPVEMRMSGLTMSSQPPGSLPTPSPSTTPSLASGSLSSHPSTLTAPEFSRLSQYTTFNPKISAPAPLPKRLSNILAHWIVGVDPGKYDWLATKYAQDQEAEFNDQELSSKERARLKRRAERHLQRQRRETAAAQAQGITSSQAPQLVSASQPVALHTRPTGASQPLVLLGSSSQTLQGAGHTQTQAFPASQVEPGRFGGRGPPKKKRRTQGF